MFPLDTKRYSFVAVDSRGTPLWLLGEPEGQMVFPCCFLVYLFINLLASHCTWSSQTRDQIQAAVETYATVSATLDP